MRSIQSLHFLTRTHTYRVSNIKNIFIKKKEIRVGNHMRQKHMKTYLFHMQTCIFHMTNVLFRMKNYIIHMSNYIFHMKNFPCDKLHSFVNLFFNMTTYVFH